MYSTEYDPDHKDSSFSPYDPKILNYLSYDSEGIDEDIHVYILDKKFFGSNNDERNAAISAIIYLFNTKSVDFNVSHEKIIGVRNANPVNKKSEVLTKLKSLINKNESIRINNESSTSNGEKEELILDDHDYKVLGKAEISKNLYLSESQIYYLEHLEMSIKRSKIPFMLYIYDPNSPEKVNVDGLKHDATHILKDVVNLDKQGC